MAAAAQSCSHDIFKGQYLCGREVSSSEGLSPLLLALCWTSPGRPPWPEGYLLMHCEQTEQITLNADSTSCRTWRRERRSL